MDASKSIFSKYKLENTMQLGKKKSKDKNQEERQ